MNKKIAIIGLGKMGSKFGLNLVNKKYQVFGFDIHKIKDLKLLKNIMIVNNLNELVNKNGKTGIYLLSLPCGDVTKKTIDLLLELLNPKAIIIDAGNNNWIQTKLNFKNCKFKKIDLIDAGISGGPNGALKGSCLMVGGDKKAVLKTKFLFKDLAQKNGFLHVGNSGSGHFLKMIHNGIEYGMMQAIAEGFAVLNKSEFNYDLEKVAKLWNSGSVIRSWLIELCGQIFQKKNLNEFENTAPIVNATGEAKWTIQAALELNVPTPVIALSLMLRQQSDPNNIFTNQTLAQLRKSFGGHFIVKK